MANQDILFPLLPRNTRVEVRDPNLKVNRINKKERGQAVLEEEAFDATQEARIQDYMDAQRDLQQKNRQQQNARQEREANGENLAKQALPDTSPVADDPRRKHSDNDDDSHKGVYLDTFV